MSEGDTKNSSLEEDSSSQYETATEDETTVTTSAQSGQLNNPPEQGGGKELPITEKDEQSENSDSVKSFFDAHKAPESSYQAKIRKEKEFAEQKKRNAAQRTTVILDGEDFKQPLAPEHYTVEKKRRQWDDDLKKFRERQRKLLKNIRVSSKRKVAQLHERIFFTIRWANPSLPNIFRKTILEYCEHLMGPYPERKYDKINVLGAWYSKFSHTPEAKVVEEVKQLCERLRLTVLKRDEKTVQSIVKLEEKTELLTIQKDGDLRWHMETMHCARDDYWTIWYLARRNQTLELLRMLETCKDVDARDPDFGFTPLHYACKECHWEAFSILLKHGASEKSVIEEDGRQPLHLAAQHGTKEMCLELLAVGADFDAKDKYGSTALDLAIQSKNYSVIKVLQNWTQLLPPEEEKVEVQEDLSAVPEEFMSTPYEVLITMSPALRVITTRLEGTDVNATHSLDSGKDVGVEIRLCERRCNMCLEEGFDFEALKSKKRRWTVAKNGYIKQFENLPIGGAQESQIENGLSLKSIVEQENENNNESVQSPKPTKNTSTKLTASFLYSICNDLYEYLIKIKSYEEAERIMTDGLGVLLLDDATRSTFLKRHCQLLLFLSDRMSAAERAQPSVTMGTHSRPKVNPTIEQSFAPDDFNHTTSIASLNVSDDDSKNYHDNPDLFTSTAPASLLQQSSLLKGNSVVNPSVTAPYVVQSVVEGEGNIESNFQQYSSQDFAGSTAANTNSVLIPQQTSPHDMILMRAEGCVNEALDLLKSNYDFNFIEPVSLSPLLELAAEVADRQGRYMDALHFMEHSATVKERTLGQAHSDTVRVFIESLRLLLRKHLVLAAVRKEKRDAITRAEDDVLNESISSKLMNEKKINKLREARRVEGLAEDKKCFSEVGLQATDVSRRLDRLSLENEEEALKLSTKCYNLVSLTELIVQGEVDPNQVLPNKAESISLNSLNSKYFPPEAMVLQRTPYGESRLAEP